MDRGKLSKKLINGFSENGILDLLEELAGRGFVRQDMDLSGRAGEQWGVDKLRQAAELDLGRNERLMVVLGHSQRPLHHHWGRRQHWVAATTLLKKDIKYLGGLFVFYDDSGAFRFSLVHTVYQGTRRAFTPYKRASFMVEPKTPNKTLFCIRQNLSV